MIAQIPSFNIVYLHGPVRNNRCRLGIVEVANLHNGPLKIDCGNIKPYSTEKKKLYANFLTLNHVLSSYTHTI